MSSIRTRRGLVRSARLTTDTPLWQTLIVLVIIMALVAWIVWQAFDFGRYRAGFDSSQVGTVRNALHEELTELRAQNSELRQRLAVLERGDQVDKKAGESAREQFRQLQEDRSRLEKEVAFLRSIVTPDQSEEGLQIKDFSLRTGGKDDDYRFRFVLTRSKKGKNRVKGKVSVSLFGISDGKIIEVEPDAITVGKKSAIDFRFKNFQTLEGVVRLPEGFAPDSLMLKINPTTKGYDEFVRRFDWIVQS